MTTAAELLAARSLPAGLKRICLTAGTYALADNWSRPKTILVGPATGTAAVKGRFVVSANDVTLKRITFDAAQNNSPLAILADNVSLLDSAVTNPNGFCLTVGYVDAVRYENGKRIPIEPEPTEATSEFERVSNVLVKGNRISNCANAPSYLASSGCRNDSAPGIYTQWTDRLEISENELTDTGSRAIQAYPYNVDVTITRNLFRRTAIPMNIGSDNTWGQAKNISITDNVFAEQQSAALAAAVPQLALPACAGNLYLTYNSPPGTSVFDNATGKPNPPTVTIAGNCGVDARYNGPTNPDGSPTKDLGWGTNVVKAAVFTGPTDNRQTSASPCRSVGPTRYRAVAPPARLVVTATPLPAAKIGDEIRHSFDLTNDSDTNLTVTVTPTLAPSDPGTAVVNFDQAKVAPIGAFRTFTVNGAACTTATCSVAIPAHGSVKATADYGVGRSGSLISSMKVTAPGATAATDSVTTTVAGNTFCSVRGTKGNDVLTAPTTDGANLCGFSGNDRLVVARGGGLVLGGAGTDVADYSKAEVVGTNGWNLSLATNATVQIGGTRGDTLTGIEGLVGTKYADVITGGSGNDALTGGDGADTIKGGAGNDTIDPGLGADKAYGEDGVDWVLFSSLSTPVTASLTYGNASTVVGGVTVKDIISTFENLRGGSASDQLTGNTAANRIEGLGGNDTIKAGAGNDALVGGEGSDLLYGQAGNDTYTGGNPTTTPGDLCANDGGTDTKSGCERSA